jgi:hypothetical protein
MNEPMVRVLAAKCEACGHEFAEARVWRGEILAVDWTTFPVALPVQVVRGMKSCSHCGLDSVLVATEPVEAP